MYVVCEAKYAYRSNWNVKIEKLGSLFKRLGCNIVTLTPSNIRTT